MKKYINQQDMRDANVYNVLRLIRKEGRLTRRNIEAKTNLSWGAVSKVTSILLEGNYIREVEIRENKGPGRTPIYLEINPDEYFTVGLDVNKSGLFAVLINMKNEVKYFTLRKIEYFSEGALITEILNIISEVMDFSKGHKILGIGIAMQGLVDSVNGVSVKFPACEDWKNVNLKEIVEEKFNVPAFVEHDPECILYAHSESNNMDDCILIRVDNGIGMAVMINGKIFKRFGAFELGHLIADDDMPLAYSASLDGIEKKTGESFETVKKKAYAGDETMKGIFLKMGRLLGKSIRNVSELLNVRNVLICGEMFENRELFYDTLKEYSGGEVKYFEADVKNAATGAGMIAMNLSQISF